MKRTMQTLRAAFAFALFAGALAVPAAAQDASPVGDWQGTLSAGGQEFPLVLHVVAGEDGLTATMDSPSQGAFGIPGDTATFSEGTLTISFSSIAGSYEATLGEDGDTLSGTWTQGGMSLPLELTRAEG
jgi:hypothetical protein